MHNFNNLYIFYTLLDVYLNLDRVNRSTKGPELSYASIAHHHHE